MYDCIIPLGQTCNITFLLQNAKLKKQTSLFEWFVSNHLNHITSVLQKIVEHTDTDIISVSGGYVCIGDDTIFSEHYKLAEFQEIYKRRRDRFIETIRASKSILFARFDGTLVPPYSSEEIDNFLQVIRRINPEIEKATLLLISMNPTKIEHPSVAQFFYTEHASDPYCRGYHINSLFMNALKSVGYNVADTTAQRFTDKSLI